MTEFLFISPQFDQIKKIETYYPDGDALDAVNSFKSLVWQQGWGADERVLEEYGDWLIYEKPQDITIPLPYRGQVHEY